MRFEPVADSAGDRNRTPGGRSGQRPSIRAARGECGCRFCRNLQIGGTMAVAVLAGMSDTVAVFAAVPRCLVAGVWGGCGRRASTGRPYAGGTARGILQSRLPILPESENRLPILPESENRLPILPEFTNRRDDGGCRFCRDR